MKSCNFCRTLCLNTTNFHDAGLQLAVAAWCGSLVWQLGVAAWCGSLVWHSCESERILLVFLAVFGLLASNVHDVLNKT